MVPKDLPEPKNDLQRLLKLCWEKGLSTNERYEIFISMKGKTEEEKEAMAAEAIAKLQAEKR